MAEINIWESFESPDVSSTSAIDPELTVGKLRIEPCELGLFGDEGFSLEHIDMVHPRLNEMIQDYNNKVGSLIITYTLLRHYYDKGIPDDPWYISPGPNGESIKYMPLFENEHWGRRYWFSYFSDTYYLRIFSLWDSVLELINHFYGYNIPVDLRFRGNLIKNLKNDHPLVAQELAGIQQEPIYITAQANRTAAAHGVSQNSVTNTVHFDPNGEMDVPIWENGALKTDESGKPIMKKVHGPTVSHCVGDYTLTKSIMDNIDQYTAFSCNKIHSLMQLVKSDN